MNYSNHEIAQMFDKTFEDGIEELDTSKVVVMKDIDLFSYCEHHMALMYDMKATVAYIPNGKVIQIFLVTILSYCIPDISAQNTVGYFWVIF